MFARLATRPAQLTSRMIQARGHSVVSGPPQVKVSFGEKVAHGAVMFAAWFTIPVWVLTHMKEYKGQK